MDDIKAISNHDIYYKEFGFYILNEYDLTLFIFCNEIIWIPTLTRNRLIIVNLRFSSIILPVMGIKTSTSIVLQIVKWTPINIFIFTIKSYNETEKNQYQDDNDESTPF